MDRQLPLPAPFPSLNPPLSAATEFSIDTTPLRRLDIFLSPGGLREALATPMLPPSTTVTGEAPPGLGFPAYVTQGGRVMFDAAPQQLQQHQQQQKIPSLLPPGDVIACSAPPQVPQAACIQAQQPQDEWFDVEVIVYNTSKQGQGTHPYECGYPGCCKAFSDRSNLITHIRMHTQEKPFVCPQCGRSFRHKSTLRDHRHVHSGAQPYICHCGKKFSQKSNLQRHQKIHSGTTPYKCQLCGKQFNQSSNLKTHLNTKHRDDLVALERQQQQQQFAQAQTMSPQPLSSNTGFGMPLQML